MTIRHFVWAAVLVLTTAPGAMAQTRATAADLTGTVVDQTNAVLPGATITVTNTDTNAVRTATTDDRGRYTIPALPPGTYTVTCDLSGFGTDKAEVTLTLGEWRTLEFGLRVAGTTDWTRRNFARWLFEDYPRAIAVTPGRWREHTLSGAGARL